MRNAPPEAAGRFLSHTRLEPRSVDAGDQPGVVVNKSVASLTGLCQGRFALNRIMNKFYSIFSDEREKSRKIFLK